MNVPINPLLDSDSSVPCLRDNYVWSHNHKILTPKQHGIIPLYTFGHTSITNAREPLAKHFHKDCIEIIFMIKGHQYFDINNTAYNIHGNDILVIYPNESHSSSDIPQSLYERFWIQLDLRNFSSMFCLGRQKTNYIKKSLLALPRIMKADSELLHSLKFSFTYLSSPNQLNRVIGEQYFLCCLYQLMLLSKKDVTSQTDVIDAAIEYIHNHIYKPISLEELSKYCALSLSYFKVLFRQKTGHTPRSYINYQKINQSKILLKNHSISETSSMLAFDTPNYFATVFKKYEGISPREYLAKLQKYSH